MAGQTARLMCFCANRYQYSEFVEPLGLDVEVRVLPKVLDKVEDGVLDPEAIGIFTDVFRDIDPRGFKHSLFLHHGVTDKQWLTPWRATALADFDLILCPGIKDELRYTRFVPGVELLRCGMARHDQLLALSERPPAIDGSVLILPTLFDRPSEWSLRHLYPRLVKGLRGAGIEVGVKIHPECAVFFPRIWENYRELCLATGASFIETSTPLIEAFDLYAAAIGDTTSAVNDWLLTGRPFLIGLKSSTARKLGKIEGTTWYAAGETHLVTERNWDQAPRMVSEALAAGETPAANALKTLCYTYALKGSNAAHIAESVKFMAEDDAQ